MVMIIDNQTDGNDAKTVLTFLPHAEQPICWFPSKYPLMMITLVMVMEWPRIHNLYSEKYVCLKAWFYVAFPAINLPFLDLKMELVRQFNVTRSNLTQFLC